LAYYVGAGDPGFFGHLFHGLGRGLAMIGKGVFHALPSLAQVVPLPGAGIIGGVLSHMGGEEMGPAITSTGPPDLGSLEHEFLGSQTTPPTDEPYYDDSMTQLWDDDTESDAYGAETDLLTYEP
jgi:hypothetical protein